MPRPALKCWKGRALVLAWQLHWCIAVSIAVDSGRRLRHAGLDAVPEGLMCREAEVWRIAAIEAGVNMSNVSKFGRCVGKFPASWVKMVDAMDHRKNLRYNFQGSLFSNDVLPHRNWLLLFASKDFSGQDYFRVTDAPKGNFYSPLGSFDMTLTPGGFRPKEHAYTSRWSEMDPAYFQVLTRSNFTLSPRGDRPFSYRLYEAALSRSIPVLRSWDQDLAPMVTVYNKATPIFGTSYPQMLRCIGYHYYSLDHDHGPLQYREDWAEENYRLFIKYQTFIEGDNTPPGCPDVPF